MADRSGLGILGGIFASVTVAVVATAFIVVLGHIDGSLALDAAQSAAVSIQ